MSYGAEECLKRLRRANDPDIDSYKEARSVTPVWEVLVWSFNTGSAVFPSSVQ